MVGEATLPAEQLALVHDFVVSGVRNVDWPLSAFDYQARPAGEVLQSSVGHSLDKAVLLTAMLRYLGFKADLALVSSEREIAADVPSPVWFDQAWVRVKTPDRAIWLDPTASRNGHNRFDLAGHPTLLVAEGEEMRMFSDLEWADNRASLWIEGTIVDEGGDLVVSGEVEADYAYGTNPLVAFDRSTDGPRELAGQVVAVFGGAEVDQVMVGHRSDELLAFGATFSGGKLKEVHGLPIRVDLPRLPGLPSSSALQSHRQQRTLPLVLPDGALSSVVGVKLTLPAGWQPIVIPAALQLENEVGKVIRTVELKGDELTLRTELILLKAVVEASLWPDLRTILTAVEAESARVVLLRSGS